MSARGPRAPQRLTAAATGCVYERRLIEQYINEHATEPATGEALSAEDLLPLKSSPVVRPRPPALTSIPALLATFQSEWDTLALETYNVKEQLARAREELSTALYQHDAAVRVVARLTRERDEARDALSRVTVTDGTVNADDMAVDSVEALPEALAERVDETHTRSAAEEPPPHRRVRADARPDCPRDARSARSPRAGSRPTRCRHSTCRHPTRCP